MVLKVLRRQGVQGGAQGGHFFKVEVQRLDAKATPLKPWQQPNIYSQLRSIESFADSPWQFEQELII
jgi:hypothetical protein